jgi:2-polyprenyl-3-methyl-5-hydroxy-6-metoxy-1,4-benzoquinol methylase
MRPEEPAMAPHGPAAAANLELYGRVDPGVLDYWRFMAAPRFRMRTFVPLIRESRARSLVDLGCGSGLLLAEVHRAAPEIALCGVDLSSPQIDANRTTRPDFAWLVADLDQPVSFPPSHASTYEAVVASEIIEHLDHPETLLRNALALARPGIGRLLLSTQSGALRTTERYVGHRRHFTAEELRSLLEHSGWRALRVWNAGFPFHDLSKWFANLRPDATLRRFSGLPYGRSERLTCALLDLLFRVNSRRGGAQLFALAAAPPETSPQP